MAARAYVETSIPRFFSEAREQPDMVARRDWKRAWWAKASATSELVTSPAVAVLEVVEAYIRHLVMPADPVGDALHLALASYHRCDFLVTWNCKHIANANKFGHIRRVNTLLGLFNPALVTPLELLGGTEDAE